MLTQCGQLTQCLLGLLIGLDGRRHLLPERRDGREVREAEDGRGGAAVGHVGGVAAIVQPLDDVGAVCRYRGEEFGVHDVWKGGGRKEVMSAMHLDLQSPPPPPPPPTLTMMLRDDVAKVVLPARDAEVIRIARGGHRLHPHIVTLQQQDPHSL